jgi:PAS domain-containing protein
LVTPEGHALGTLCVIDRVPRQLSSEQRRALATLSRHVMMQLELRRHLAEQTRLREELGIRERKQRELASRLTEAQAVAMVGSWDTDLATLAVTWSEQTHRIFETSPETFRPTHPGFLERVHPEDRAAVDAAFRASLQKIEPCVIEHRLNLPDGRSKTVEERWGDFPRCNRPALASDRHLSRYYGIQADGGRAASAGPRPAGARQGIAGAAGGRQPIAAG